MAGSLNTKFNSVELNAEKYMNEEVTATLFERRARQDVRGSTGAARRSVHSASMFHETIGGLMQH